MKVYFVRHGQSEGNLTFTHQNAETRLTELGLRQAQRVADRLSQLEIDIILASDFVRTQQTAAVIAQKLGLEIISEPLLREVKRPTELEGLKTDHPTAVSIKRQIKKNLHKQDWRYSDEETFWDVAARAGKLVEKLEQRTEQNILCVAHGEILRNIVLTLTLRDGYSPQALEEAHKTMHLENTGLTVCEFKQGSWELLTWNDYAHLGD